MKHAKLCIAFNACSTLILTAVVNCNAKIIDPDRQDTTFETFESTAVDRRYGLCPEWVETVTKSRKPPNFRDHELCTRYLRDATNPSASFGAIFRLFLIVAFMTKRETCCDFRDCYWAGCALLQPLGSKTRLRHRKADLENKREY